MIEHVIKHVGNDNDSKCYDNNLEKQIDTNQNLIAFNKGILYDITSNAYRPFEKTDFITKTMNHPFSSNIKPEKVTEIEHIFNSFFEDEHSPISSYRH